MIRNNKKLFASFLILISLVISGGFGAYVYGTKWLENELVRLEEDLKSQGFTLSYSNIEISGNPFELRMNLQDPTLKDPRELFEWKGEEMILSMKTWDFYTLNCVFQGPQKLTITHKTELPFSLLQFDETKAQIKLTSKGNLEDIFLSIGRIVPLLENKQEPISFHVVSLQASHLSQPLNLQFSLKVKVIGIETLLKKPPFDHPLVIDFVGNFSGYQRDIFPKTLAEWRDGGGIINVNVLKLAWPPLTAEGDGTLTLDKDMYPLGSFSSRIDGYQAALNDLVTLGWVKEQDAAAATFVLNLLSKPNETGKKQLTVPIMLQNKHLSIGPIPVVKLQPIEEY